MQRLILLHHIFRKKAIKTADSAKYSIEDIKNLAALRGKLPLITTFKDYVKLPTGWQEYIKDNFYMLEIEMHLNNDGIEDLKEVITP